MLSTAQPTLQRYNIQYYNMTAPERHAILSSAYIATLQHNNIAILQPEKDMLSGA